MYAGAGPAEAQRHIETEKKFYCTGEQLAQAERYLDRTHEDARKTEKDQTDTYFDCISDGQTWALFDSHCNFRCREKGESYTFTMKAPADSPEHRSSAWFERYEYELAADTPEITDEVWHFLADTLALCGKGYLCGDLSRERMRPLLMVCDRRITYRLDGLCEICLDTVDYKTAGLDQVGPRIYQIEIELLAGPEAWAKLEEDVIGPLMQATGPEPLAPAAQSKLEMGMALLREWDITP